DAALVATSYSTDGLALRDPAARDGPLAAVAAELAGWQRQGARLVVVATGAAQRERIRELLAGHDVDAVPSAEPFPQSVATPGRKPLALVGGLTRGVWLPADALALVTEAEIFGERRQIRRGRRARPADFLSTSSGAAPGSASRPRRASRSWRWPGSCSRSTRHARRTGGRRTARRTASTGTSPRASRSRRRRTSSGRSTTCSPTSPATSRWT